MYEKTTTYQQKHAYTQNHLQPQISTLDLKDGIYSTVEHAMASGHPPRRT